MKNKMIKLGALVLTGLLFATNGMTVQARTVFEDYYLCPGWAYQHINWARDQNIVAGKNNRFEAYHVVTRAEAATMLVKFKRIDVEQYDIPCEQFEDVGEEWYTKFINAAYANGLVSGKTDTTFDPEGQLTRAEATAMIVNAMGYEKETDTEAAFEDIAGEWYTDCINTAYAHKIVAGKSEGVFDPNAYVTRAEIVTMIHATMKESYEVGWIAKFSIAGYGSFVLTDAEGRTLNYEGVDEEGERVFSGELVETTEINYVDSYCGLSSILLEDMEGSESFTFASPDFELNGVYSSTVNFIGRNNQVMVEGNNVEQVKVNADGTIYLYGTDMEYWISFGNAWRYFEYTGTSAGDVVLKVVDGQFVEVTE